MKLSLITSMTNDSQVVSKEACPQCKEAGGDSHSDNLVLYADGGAHCFACNYHKNKTGKPPAPSKEKPMFEKATLITGSEVRALAIEKATLITGAEVRALAKRSITEETCEKFNYQVGENKYGKTVHIANYIRGGKIVAQKTRDSRKNFTFLGNAKEAGLFGQHLWRDGGKKLIITEGEIDALSISQCQGNKWPVVSVPSGAAGAARAIAQEIEFVESYEIVVFAFDMDTPGQEAAKECAALLSPGKAFIANLPLKDANQCLVEGRAQELISALWSAKPYRPDGVVGVESIIEDAAAPIEIGKSWPWAGLEKTYGRRRGELYGFGGGTGCGKSTVFKQIAKHIIEIDNLPVGMLMLEEPPKLTLKTLAGMFMGKRVHVPGVEYAVDKLKKGIAKLTGKVYFYDHFGSSNFDTIKEKIRYMVHGLGVKDIFLDHLTALAAGIEGDERKAIDRIMADLSSLTQELDCTIYFISHLTTPEGKPHEEGGRVLEKHFRGSRSIAYWSHFLFAIERDKQDLSGITTFRILKDRYTGDANGITFGLEYDKETGLLNQCELPKEKPMFDPVDDSEEPF